MKRFTFVLSILIICTLAQTIAGQATSSPRRIVLAANVVLDGKGHVMRNTRLVIEGSKIVAIDPKAGPVDYDLRGLTVLPGWIDAHAHITWIFGKDGKNAGQGGISPEATYAAAANAYATLLAGFTTVQSIGSSADIMLREAIAGRMLPGPRILTSADPLVGRGPERAHPDEIAPTSESKKKRAPTSSRFSPHRASGKAGR